jgi:hypothetical protein
MDTVPALTFEAATHRYALDGRELPSVTTILRDAGLIDFAAPWFTDEARARGTYVHEAIALLVEQDLDWERLDPTLAPYVQAFERWRTEGGCIVEACEQRVAHEALAYAGTIDLLAKRWSGATETWERYLIDVKCGAVPPSVGPQTAAYLRCLAHEGWRWRAVLQLPGDGSYRFDLLEDPEDDDDFLAALRLFHRKRRHVSR